MDFVLDDKEVRILGCLMEKEMTTPEYYPISLNSLTNACNQKSNRDPVVSYDEIAVSQGLDSLRAKGLARETQSASGRVPKYVHAVLDRFDLSRQEMAVICELLLRGPQTAGELRSRAGRMAPFGNMEEAETILRGLMEHDPALVVKLPREAGRKERRYAHLLSGAIAAEKTAHDAAEESAASEAQLHEKVIRIEEEVAKLRGELDELKKAFAEFKSQF